MFSHLVPEHAGFDDSTSGGVTVARRLARAGARSSWSEIFKLTPEGRRRSGDDRCRSGVGRGRSGDRGQKPEGRPAMAAD
eukprot:6070085-Prymnesium_polylepis.1